MHLVAMRPECAGQPPPPAEQRPQPEWRIRPPEDPLPAGAVRRIGTARFWPNPNDFSHGALSSSGSRFANVANGTGVRIWDAATGSQVAVFPDLADALSFTHGDQWLLAWDAEGRIHAIDVESGKSLWYEVVGGVCACHSRMNDSLVLSQYDSVKVVNAADGKVQIEVPFPPGDHWPVQVALSEAEDEAIVVCREPLEVIGASLNGSKKNWIRNIEHEFAAIRLSHDGELVITASDDLVMIRESRTGKERFRRQRVTRGRWYAPSPAIFAPHGPCIAFSDNATLDGEPWYAVKVCDWEYGGKDQVLAGHGFDAENLQFSEDGRVLIATAGRQLAAWHLPDGTPLWYNGWRSSIRSLRFAPDDRQLVTTAFDGVHVYDVATGRELLHKRARIGIDFMPESRSLLTFGPMLSLEMVDIDTGKSVRLGKPFGSRRWDNDSNDEMRLIERDNGHRTLWEFYSPETAVLDKTGFRVVMDDLGHIVSYSLASGERTDLGNMGARIGGTGNWAYFERLSPDGSTAVFENRPGEHGQLAWTISPTMEAADETIRVPTQGGVDAACFLTKPMDVVVASWVPSTSGDTCVSLVRMRDGKTAPPVLLESAHFPDDTNRPSIELERSDDCRRLICGVGPHVFVIDAEKLSVEEHWTGHIDDVVAAAFSHDGTLAATASLSEVLIWKLE